MSRGGRGGGRGGFGGAKRPQAPGSEFSFGPEAGEPTGISDYAPMPLFPVCSSSYVLGLALGGR